MFAFDGSKCQLAELFYDFRTYNCPGTVGSKGVYMFETPPTIQGMSYESVGMKL